MARDPILDIPALERFGIDTGIFAVMNSKWGWPAAESIHFLGICLLMASVGMFDLRLLGVARGVRPYALHRLIPIGVIGWLMCVTTGVLFVLTAPGQYLYNPAFQSKMTMMMLAGVNMVAFYLFDRGAVEVLGPDDSPPLRSRIAGAVSILMWLGVISAGRWITFFRPPYHWCVWCS